MPRIPDEEIERVKREVTVADLARRRGIELRGSGDNLMGLCPFHPDKTPSLVISPAKNLWNCLGACQEGGDVIAWVMKSEHVPFRRAVELLHRGYPDFSDALKRGPREKREKSEVPECPIALEMSDAEVIDAVIRHYEARLFADDAPSVEARKMMERRGIWNEGAVRHFRIGFADRTIGNLLPGPELKAGKMIRAKLAELGIYRADSGREHFRGCVVFPVVDASGAIVEIYGRKIRDDMRHRVGRHVYLPGPHRGIWNGEALRETKELIVCEAIIDALTFWIHGHRNVIAAYGVNGFTEEMFEAVKANAITKVLIAYDRDEAGDAAAAKLAARLSGEGIGCYRVLLPRMMDVNEYAKKVAPAAQSLGVALRSAEYLSGPKSSAAIVSPGPLPSSLVRHPKYAEPEFLKVVEPDTPLQPDNRSQHRENESAGPALETAEVKPALPSLAANGKRAVKDAADEREPDELPTAAAAAGDAAAVSSAGPAASTAGDPANIAITLGDREYRIRGLEKNLSFSSLKVIVRVARGAQVFLDQVDLISARQRAQFVKQAATDLGVKEEIIKHDIAAVYRELEVLQEQMIRKTLEPKETRPVMTERELGEAMELLRDPKLLERVVGDYERAGVVGERTNKLMAYLAATSRLADDPLAILIQSSSAAGKTTLMDAVLSFIPEEERVRYSAMTGQSLFYFEGKSLQHKILAISEEEGAERASYALKLLQSEGQLTIASTGKDPQTGRLTTQEYHVEGPVMIILTTTAIEIDEELLNRCIVLTVDEERAQTRAIHALQRRRETLEGLLAREERSSVLKLHQNAQRLLRPLRVVNNLAETLTFLDSQTRTRRDHMKYLTLIRTIALLHQHQRPRKSVTARDGRAIEYIEVVPSDIVLANELADEVLGRSLDELPPQTRRLLEIVEENVTRECARRAIARCDFHFLQRDVREWTSWSDYQVKTHLHKLVTMEYVLIHRGGRGQSFVYELLYDGKGKNGRSFFPGLIDVTTTSDRVHHDDNREHGKEWRERSGRSQGAAGLVSGSSAENPLNVSADAVLRKVRTYKLKNTHGSGNGKDSSYAGAIDPLDVAASH